MSVLCHLYIVRISLYIVLIHSTLYSYHSTLPTAQKWTGVVTTTRVTHATPANTYAHVGERKAEAVVPDDVIEGDKCKDIASQLIDDNDDIRVSGRQK